MRHPVLTVLAAVALITAAVPAVRAAPAPTGATGYIVVFKQGVAAASTAREHSREYKTKLKHTYTHALHGYAATMKPSVAKEIAGDPRVDFVQADQVVRSSAQTRPTGVARVGAGSDPARRLARAGAAAGLVPVGGRVDVDVAVIDSGIQSAHPDLNVHTAGAKNCTTGAGAEDGSGHGTHVAGTIGALDNTEGVVGVAPGVRLWPVRVLDDSGRGAFSSIICGIDHVTAHAAEIEVANMSLGGFGSDDGDCGRTNNDAMHRAICASVAAGITYTAAAGNGSTQADSHVPAAYDEVITVSALSDFDGLPGGLAKATCGSGKDDTFAGFSNYGPDIDLIAPGDCILSTWLNGGYSVSSGTSMAAPHVAGAAALYKAAHPKATPAEVKAALQAAGTLDWTTTGDPDGIKEKLLDVRSF